MNFFTTESSSPQSRIRQGKLLPQSLLPTLSFPSFSCSIWDFVLSKGRGCFWQQLSLNSAETQTLPVLSSWWQSITVWCWWEETNSVYRNVTGCTISRGTRCVGLMWQSFGSGGCKGDFCERAAGAAPPWAEPVPAGSKMLSWINRNWARFSQVSSTVCIPWYILHTWIITFCISEEAVAY